jgi:hypothetical protein
MCPAWLIRGNLRSMRANFIRNLPGAAPRRHRPDRFRLHLRGHRTGEFLGSEIAAYTVTSMMLPMSAESDGVPSDESPTLHFAGSSLDLEMRPWFISVNSRLSVSDGWRSRRFAQLLSPSTDGNIFDFRNIAFPGTMSACWSLKCIPRRRDFANHITPWGVDIGRRRPGRNKWPSLHQI